MENNVIIDSDEALSAEQKIMSDDMQEIFKFILDDLCQRANRLKTRGSFNEGQFVCAYLSAMVRVLFYVSYPLEKNQEKIREFFETALRSCLEEENER